MVFVPLVLKTKSTSGNGFKDGGCQMVFMPLVLNTSLPLVMVLKTCQMMVFMSLVLTTSLPLVMVLKTVFLKTTCTIN